MVLFQDAVCLESPVMPERPERTDVLVDQEPMELKDSPAALQGYVSGSTGSGPLS